MDSVKSLLSVHPADAYRPGFFGRKETGERNDPRLKFLGASVGAKQACCGTHQKYATGMFLAQTVLALKGVCFAQHLPRKFQRGLELHAQLAASGGSSLSEKPMPPVSWLSSKWRGHAHFQTTRRMGNGPTAGSSAATTARWYWWQSCFYSLGAAFLPTFAAVGKSRSESRPKAAPKMRLKKIGEINGPKIKRRATLGHARGPKQLLRNN